MKLYAVLILLTLCSCGGSGGDDGNDDVAVAAAPAPAPTPIEVTSCGDITVDVSQVPEVVEAAEEEGVEVTDFLDEEEEEIPGLNQDAALKTGVIIAACGSTVVNNESITVSNTSTTVSNPADRLIALIRAHEVATIEVGRRD